MKAFTLWPEWAWAILHLGKRLENRGWSIPTGVVGVPVAIHAGKHIGGRPGKVAMLDGIAGVVEMATRSGWMANYCESKPGVLVAFFEKDGVVIRTDETPILTSSLVGVARFGFSSEPYSGNLQGWRVPDQHGWPMRTFAPLKSPVECKGAQGFWKVPPEIAARMEWVNG